MGCVRKLAPIKYVNTVKIIIIVHFTWAGLLYTQNAIFTRVKNTTSIYAYVKNPVTFLIYFQSMKFAFNLGFSVPCKSNFYSVTHTVKMIQIHKCKFFKSN